jgi:mRNA interferase HigB
MKLLGKQLLYGFIEKHADARSQVGSWLAEVEGANWKAPYELKYRYPKASILGNQQVIYDICGNKYRLWTQISYKNGIVLIKNIGTHKEYENWNLG